MGLRWYTGRTTSYLMRAVERVHDTSTTYETWRSQYARDPPSYARTSKIIANASAIAELCLAESG